MNGPTLSEAPSEWVCWSTSEETLPASITANNGQEAAKLFVLRLQSSPGSRCHDNKWSAMQVWVVNYTTGVAFTFTVKVTVEAHQ